MTTSNANFKVKNGLDAGGNISTTGTVLGETDGGFKAAFRQGPNQLTLAWASFESNGNDYGNIGMRNALYQRADSLYLRNSGNLTVFGIGANGNSFTGSTIAIQGTSTAITVASASSATVATYTHAGTTQLVQLNQIVTISGFITQPYFNGTYQVTSIGGVSGAWTFTVTSPGAVFTISTATQYGSFTLSSQNSITTSSAGTIGQIIRATTNQVSNLQEWQNSAGTIQASIDANGMANLLRGNFRGAVYGTGTYYGAVNILQESGGHGVVIQGRDSQTTDLLRIRMGATPGTGNDALMVQNSSGTTLARIDSGGNLKASNVATLNSAGQMTEANSGALFVMGRATAQSSLPGLNFGNLYFRDGTTAGTLRLATRTGAAGVEETIVDNISSTTSTAGARFTGAGGILTTGSISGSGGISLTGGNSPISLPTGGNGTSGQTIISNGVGTTPYWGMPTYPSTAQQLFLASPTSGSGTPTFRYISTSDFTQSSSPGSGQALVAAPVTGGWSWSTVITNFGGSLSGTLSITGTLAQVGASSPITLNTSAGTSGQVLTSAGAGATPTWNTPNLFTSGAGTAPGTTAGTNYPIFPSANDTISLPVGTYKVEFVVRSTVATSTVSSTMNFSIAGAGAALGSFAFVAQSFAGSGTSGADNIFSVSGFSGTGTVVTSASAVAGRNYIVHGNGILKITTAGTIIPSISWSSSLTSGTVTLDSGNYMIITQLSNSGTAASVGSWS